MIEFANFVRDAGLLPREIIADNRWRRCPTEAHPRSRNGSYKLLDSGTLGFAQNWEIHSEPLMWKADRESFTPVLIDTSKRLADERQAMIKATRAAREFYAKCPRLTGEHSYLKSHSLSMVGCFGLRVDSDGWLVVPVMLGKSIISLQRISPDGDKKFWFGASVKGGYYLIDRSTAVLTVICEGLATGLAIYSATPTSRVYVGFNAGNMAKLKIQVTGLAVCAGDNDHETQARIGRNPGADAAMAAANVFGCGFVMPTGIVGTDWCDYRMERVAKLWSERDNAREGELRRGVDGEIAAAMMRNAVFVRH